MKEFIESYVKKERLPRTKTDLMDYLSAFFSAYQRKIANKRWKARKEKGKEKND